MSAQLSREDPTTHLVPSPDTAIETGPAHMRLSTKRCVAGTRDMFIYELVWNVYVDAFGLGFLKCGCMEYGLSSFHVIHIVR